MPKSKKESRFKNIIKSYNKSKLKKTIKSYKTETIAGGTAAAATFGAGMIDLRPKAKLKGAPYLGDTYDDIRHALRAGDVLVGGHKTNDEVLKGTYNSFKDTYRYQRQQKAGRINAFKSAVKNIEIGPMFARTQHPNAIHTTLITSDQGAASFGGTGYSNIKHEIPENKETLQQWKKQGREPRYTLMRPRYNANVLSQLETHGVSIPDFVASKAGDGSDYKGMQGVKAQIKDWLLPKLNRVEKEKINLVKQLDVCTVKGGLCSTTPAQLSNRTIGGKTTYNVLPIDYLRSPDYDVVGKIGKKGKSSLLSRAVFSIPKYVVKGGAAAAVGGTVYGGVKGYKAIKAKFSNKKGMTKKAFLENVYHDAFNNELLLIRGK